VSGGPERNHSVTEDDAAMTLDEIADATGLTRGGAWVVVHRAVRKIWRMQVAIQRRKDGRLQDRSSE